MKLRLSDTLNSLMLGGLLMASTFASADNKPTKPYWQDVQVVAVNKESTHVIPFTVQRGSISSPVPTKMIAKKLTARIKEGFVRRPSKRTRPLDRFKKEKINNNTR